jgi:hypothetical protein
MPLAAHGAHLRHAGTPERSAGGAIVRTSRAKETAMNPRYAKAIEMLANLSVIAVALLGCVLLTRNLLPGGRSQPPAAVKSSALQPSIGTQVSLPGVDWATRKQTVVLVLSTRCRFCSESAPFFRRLEKEVRGRRTVRLIAVFPQDAEEASAYLNSLGVAVEEVIQAPLDSMNARGTPTLALVDDRGLITHAWVGRIPPGKEDELMGWLQ